LDLRVFGSQLGREFRVNIGAEMARLARYGWRGITKPQEVRLGGFRVRPPPGAGGRVLASLYAEKYEELERRALPDLLRPEDRVVEVGSAIGVVGLVCARIVGPERLWMVEANPDLAETIRANFALNGMAAPQLHIGLGCSEPGDPIAFRVAKEFWSSSVLERGQTARVELAPRIDLNQLLRASQASVLICDIEGGEFELLPKLDLTGIRLIVAELHRKLGRPGAVESLLSGLQDSGFRRKLCFKDEVYILERQEGTA